MSAHLIRGAAIVAVDPEIGNLSRGDILVKDDLIAAVIQRSHPYQIMFRAIIDHCESQPRAFADHMNRKGRLQLREHSSSTLCCNDMDSHEPGV